SRRGNSSRSCRRTCFPEREALGCHCRHAIRAAGCPGNPARNLFDAELPIVIEILGEIDGYELDDSLGHLLGPAHAGVLHAVLDEVLTRPFDGTTGDRPAVGEVLVIAHSGAVPAKVIGDSLQRFAFGSGEAAFGDTLTEPLDDLAHLA